jgi:hypothetical protein
LKENFWRDVASISGQTSNSVGLTEKLEVTM